MPRNKYPEETVQRILDTSLRLFLEKGYEQTTVLDIVDNLGGLTRGAFYHHFKSKEEVLDAIDERFFGKTIPVADIDANGNLNGLEKLKALALISVENLSKPGSYRDFQVQQINLLKNPHYLAKQIKTNQKVAADIAPIIEQGIKDGSIKATDSGVLADLFMLLLNLWIYPSVFPCGRAEFVTKIQTCKRIFDSLGFPIIDEEILERLNVIIEVFGIT